MSELICKSYLFSGREYLVLSAYAGMEEVPILQTDEMGQLDRAEMNSTVFELYRKGILCWKTEHRCEVKPEVHQLFQIVKNADVQLQVASGNGRELLQCFGSQDVVVTERSDMDYDRIRMHRLSMRDFLEELCDRGIIPIRDSMETEEMEDEPFLRRFLQETMLFFQEERFCRNRLQEWLSAYPEVHTYIVVYSGVQKREPAMIVILDCGLYDALVCMGKETLRVCNYTMENLQRMLTEMGGMEK